MTAKHWRSRSGGRQGFRSIDFETADAVVALGESHEQDEDFDVGQFREEADRDDRAQDFLSDD